MLVAVPAVALHRFFRDSIPFVIQFGKLLKGSGEQKKYDANAIRDDLYEGLGMEKRATTSIKRQPRHQPRGGGHAQMLRAALDIAAEGSWRDTSLSDIADRADMDIAEICVLAPTKMTLTSLLIDAVDQQVMAGGPAEKEDTVRSAHAPLRRSQRKSGWRTSIYARRTSQPASGLVCGDASNAVHGHDSGGGWPVE
jgi:hypothetical protein